MSLKTIIKIYIKIVAKYEKKKSFQRFFYSRKKHCFRKNILRETFLPISELHILLLLLLLHDMNWNMLRRRSIYNRKAISNSSIYFFHITLKIT